MRTQQHDDAKPIRFRAATIDEAIELAEQSLGARTRVIEANQLRRGGIGGFFAADLGVEISVVVDDETVEDALARIVDEAAAQERDGWRERGALRHDAGESETAQDGAAEGAAGPAASFPAASFPAASSADASAPDVAVEDDAARHDFAPHDFADALRVIEEATKPARAAPVVPTVRSVAAELGIAARPIERNAVSAPPAPPVPKPEARPEVVRREEPATIVERAPAPVATNAPLTPSRIERLEAAFASLREGMPMQAKARPSAPTRRQVELVVAAAEQLIDTIAARGPAGKVSVRVVIRNSQGAEAEATADLDNRIGVQS